MNKFIDRMLFIELVQRLISGQSPSSYAYISMGGKHLTDQHLIYRRTGISNLFSFDMDEAIIERQNCNLPTDTVVCERMESSQVPGAIEDILGKFENCVSFVCWLDYTQPSKRSVQISEFRSLLKSMRPGDILRISMNANSETLVKHPSEWKDEGYASPGAFRAFKLREQLGEYFPNSVSEIPAGKLAESLLEAVKLVCSQAETTSNDCKYALPLATTYKDGQRMFTATVVALEKGEALPESIENWEFADKVVDSLLRIDAPVLSVREKHQIDRLISQESEQILKQIQFSPSQDSDPVQAIDSYKALHRFYPEFQNVEVI